MRQKDPLSPMLLNLVVEGFTQRFRQEKENDQITTTCWGLTIFLIFADDLLCFCKANRRSFTAIKRILQNFASFSGLEPNNDKSAIFLTISGVQDRDLVAILNFQIKKLLATHLGLPLVEREMRVADCAPLIDQLNNYLMTWKNRSLSYGG